MGAPIRRGPAVPQLAGRMPRDRRTLGRDEQGGAGADPDVDLDLARHVHTPEQLAIARSAKLTHGESGGKGVGAAEG